MAFDSDLNKVLLVIGLQYPSKDATSKGFPTCEDREDLFMDMADDKEKIEATFRLAVDTKIVTDIDIHCFMFVLTGFWPTLLTQTLHGPTSLAPCMSMTSDHKLLQNQPILPRLLLARILPLSTVLSISQPMCSLLILSGK
jgi:hypothetical protein